MALEHTFDTVRDFYSNPSYVGIGLWDGDVSVQNFFVYDTSMITEHYDVFDALNAEDYTEASYNAYKDAIEDAKDGFTATEIAELIEALNDAKDGLVDISSLKDVVEEIENEDTSKYTEESVKALEEALENAKAVMVEGNAEDVQDAMDALLEAYDALVEKTTDTPVVDPENPGTGDTTNVAGLMALLLASAYVLLRRKKA